ncbi:MAG: tRNA (adenosine(37)-N6)-threonylcarbamoyltransferase complex dimerization subunit type 1 TsaB [Flavobacteriales bacterium]
MTLLCIESATLNCSVAIWNNGDVGVHFEEHAEHYIHAERLHVLINDALNAFNGRPDAIAISTGPGSYTGLRIGVSAAKGLAEGYGIPIIAVPTLDQFALHMRELHPGYDFYVPLLDARRMEAYTRTFDAQGYPLNTTNALAIGPTSFSEELNSGRVLFFGDAAAKTQDVISHINAHFVTGALPNALGVGQLGTRLAEEGHFADVITLEPFYLKDFIAGTPKKQL